ncbi:LysR family transcriptional regulator [Kitasatospora saccharophila]|uniref:LysR family transcriptional regulator n=2 Tax=Kitasatospora saccharophila TaxID=407973 RepID=A0ABN2X5W3_9ACTN
MGSQAEFGIDRYRGGMDRLETRELAHFLALAEELHFGRAARRLGISQPALSRTVARLERRVGAPLLLRGGREQALTGAGRVLAREAAAVLAAADAALHRTRRAGQHEPRLVLAVKPGGDGGLLPALLAAHRAGPDPVRVDVLLCDPAERVRLLHDGTADLALLHHPPHDLTGLDTELLLTENQLAVLPRTHPLADRPRLRPADLAGEPTVRWQGTSGPDRAGPEVRDLTQLQQLVALGQAVAVLPESVRGQLRADLCGIPLLGAAPTALLLAWPEHSTSPVTAAFVRTAAALVAA